MHTEREDLLVDFASTTLPSLEDSNEFDLNLSSKEPRMDRYTQFTSVIAWLGGNATWQIHHIYGKALTASWILPIIEAPGGDEITRDDMPGLHLRICEGIPQAWSIVADGWQDTVDSLASYVNNPEFWTFFQEAYTVMANRTMIHHQIEIPQE